jgi:sodium transport system ATP-binding protein
MSTLKVDGLVKRFEMTDQERKTLGVKDKYKTVVNNVSFEVHSGEIVGLLGPNGAGKTTTMRLISSLINPESGDVLFDDKSIFKDIDVRRRIAFMTSDLKLDPKSSANEMFLFFADLYNIPKSEMEKRKKELFEKFGIDGFADKKIAKLSQGMAQKVKIAISLLHNPDFIIFDEPTNGLDVVASRIVKESLMEMKASGKCIILSTHLFDLAEKVCDRVVMIHKGNIIANDTLANLTKDKNLEDSFYDIYTTISKEEV